MGVRGLTTFIANRSKQYHENYDLHDCYVVIDGNSIGSQLYKWHCKSNDCFGGDYDKFAAVVVSFFQLLSQCKITPLIILDGAYEKRKMKTVYSRIRNKVSAAQDLNSVTEGQVSLFPIFLREAFVDVVLKMGVQCVRCDFEADNDCAHLAQTLQCPLMSYDSDFYILDVMYIPFSNVDLKLRKRKGVSYIACQMYRVEKFLESFGGLNKVNLPLLAVMLGNDYIKRRTFSMFYKQLKIQKTKQNEQQTMIKSVIVWLKSETPESALRKILGRYKLKYRRRIAHRIQRAIEAYQSGNTPVCSYFNIEEKSLKDSKITVPNPEDITSIEENSDDGSSSSEEEEQEDDQESQCVFKSMIPNFFRDNFRNALYPPCFMDMLSSSTYFCIQQIEDFSYEHSHSISLPLISATYKILTYPRSRMLTCVARNLHSHVKKYSLPHCEKDLPKLADLENIDVRQGREVLLNVLDMDDNTFNAFPKSWHLFLISIKYWVTNSKIKIDLPYIYSTLLCSIIVHFVDRKVGFYRSTKSFIAKYDSYSETCAKDTNFSQNVSHAIDQIDLSNGVACMKRCIHYFQMDAKMKSYLKLFDRTVVHQFAEFQSCLLHIKYLNSLLNSPFDSLVVSDFYDGTFLYNMTVNLQKRTDLKAYMKILLENCPKILNVFELMAAQIEDWVSSSIGKHEPPKKRKKKKKSAQSVVPDDVMKDCESDSNEATILDSNNKYSILSLLNK